MSSGFNETTILECNRLASEEGKTQNNEHPALYTNKIGSGIKLNSGDTISVQSAFISELGAGADTIQFRGRNILDNSPNNLINNYQASFLPTGITLFMKGHFGNNL